MHKTMETLTNIDVGISSEKTGEIAVYQPDEITKLEVRVNNESVWLTQEQKLFYLESNDRRSPNTSAIFLRRTNLKKFQYVPFWNELRLTEKHIGLNSIISI